MSRDEASTMRRCLARRALSPAFERWRLVLAPGAERLTDPSEWSGSLVLVERGLLEAECTSGGTTRFPAGSLIAPGWLPVRAIRNPGTQPVSLLAVRRRVPKPSSAGPR